MHSKRYKSVIKKSLIHIKSCNDEKFLFNLKLAVYKLFYKNVIYIDESGFMETDYLKFGYSRVGERCYASQNTTCRKRINVIGALHNDKIISASLFKTSVTTDVFATWIKHDLFEVIPENSLVIMDRASFHDNKKIADLFKSNGHKILFLPRYTPEYNKIEKKWAELNTYYRSFRCDTYQLFQRILGD